MELTSVKVKPFSEANSKTGQGLCEQMIQAGWSNGKIKV